MHDPVSRGSPITGAGARLRVLIVAQDGGAITEILGADQGFEVVGVPSLHDAGLAVSQMCPDVMVLALGEATTHDVEALTAFCSNDRKTRVLVVSRPAPERLVTGIIKAGVNGYLFADEARFVPDALREIARGATPMSLPISRIVLARARRNSQQLAATAPSLEASAMLTGRQQQILELLALGHSYHDIGLTLDLSVNTVRSHVKVLYERLGASTKVEAVLRGLELRLITDSPTSKGSSERSSEDHKA